jgi:hypothetical protein
MHGELQTRLTNALFPTQHFYIANATYGMSTAFIKLALLFQYLDFFPKRSFQRRFTICIAVLIGLWGAAFTFMGWFPCFPVDEYWNVLRDSGTCYGYGSSYATSFVATYEFHSGLNMIFDVIVLAIPIPIYFTKDTSRRTRLGLIGLFITGIM